MLPLTMSVTMQDIARSLNVSVVTVSKVLRNTGNISAATRKRVLRRAKQLHYQPNWVARSLVTRRTYTIGLLLPDFTHPFFAQIAKAIADTARPHGYHLLISYFEEDPELERKEANLLLARQVDGLIVASAQPPDSNKLFRSIRQRNVPLVLIDRPIRGVQASFVGVNNEGIGRMATAHLADIGCQRIAHLRGPREAGIADRRMQGYCRALKEHGLQVSAKYIVEAGYHDDTGYDSMVNLLRVTPRPDAVFCYNDPIAIGAMKAIADAGLNVPNDIAVIGAGNVHYSDVLAVPLTTIDQGTSQIGKRAAELLLAETESKRKFHPTKVLIAPRLVVRKSTQRNALS
jgi:LacI family transcriptional regulator, galactose operon repressor